MLTISSLYSALHSLMLKVRSSVRLERSFKQLCIKISSHNVFLLLQHILCQVNKGIPQILSSVLMLENFPSPTTHIYERAWTFRKSHSPYIGESSEIFQVLPSSYFSKFPHFPSHFFIFPSYFFLFPSYSFIYSPYFYIIIPPYFPCVLSYSFIFTLSIKTLIKRHR